MNQQRRQEEVQKVSQASTSAAIKSAGKQPAIKKPAQENVILSNSSVSASLAKCQSLLEVSLLEKRVFFCILFLKEGIHFK